MSTYPFLLGATSFVYHADILTNVTRLAPIVDDIELILFVVDEENNPPSPDLLNSIGAIAREHEMGFTVHLPLHLAFGDEDEGCRKSSVELAAEIINLTKDISPRGYVVHLNGPVQGITMTKEDWDSWVTRCSLSLNTLSSQSVPLSHICIENLEGYDMKWFCAVLDTMDVSVCLDIGHLWLQGKDPVHYIESYADRIRIVHFHAIHERDHSSLVHGDKKEVNRILDALTAHSFSGVLTLEVFHLDDLKTSMEVVDAWAAGKGGKG